MPAQLAAQDVAVECNTLSMQLVHADFMNYTLLTRDSLRAPAIRNRKVLSEMWN